MGFSEEHSCDTGCMLAGKNELAMEHLQRQGPSSRFSELEGERDSVIYSRRYSYLRNFRRLKLSVGGASLGMT